MTVTGVNDDLDDGDVAYSIVTAARDQRGWRSTTASIRPTSASRIPTTTPPASPSRRSAASTTEAGGTATFTVVLDAQPTADVTVGLSTSDATEGTVLPASLTFTSANWNTAQTVTVTGVNDDLDDGDIAYTS